MDSVTQAVLGAAIAHICWHKQLGRSALIWGAILGTLPDLDVILYPFLDNVQRLYWHRGESHSIWFTIFGGLMFGILISKYRDSMNLSKSRAITGVFLIFATHITIDYFTIYGTQLLAPYSRYGFSRGNLFIVDPFYTIPLLIGIIVAGAVKKGPIGWRANATGIAASSIYAVFSMTSNTYADNIFKSQLANRNITVLKSMTGATPLNTLLWRHVAKTPDGFLIGYFSLIGNDPAAPIRFEHVPQNAYLLQDFKEKRNFKAIEWFSKGFWLASKKNDTVTISDLRFGEFRFCQSDPPDTWQFVFVWTITKNPERLIRQSPSIRNGKEALSLIWGRLKGTVN